MDESNFYTTPTARCRMNASTVAIDVIGRTTWVIVMIAATAACDSVLNREAAPEACKFISLGCLSQSRQF